MSHEKRIPPPGISTKKLPAKEEVQAKSNKASANIRNLKRNYTQLAEQVKKNLSGARMVAMPVEIKPMMADHTKQPFNDKDWQFEICLGGCRTIACIPNFSSQGSEKIKIIPESEISHQALEKVTEALSRWPVNAVVDGEIVVLQQGATGEGEDEENASSTFFYLYDLLWLDGIDLTGQPLEYRKQILLELVPDTGIIRLSDHIEEWGKDFYELAKAGNHHGIIARKKNSLYQPGTHSNEWLKINCSPSSDTENVTLVEEPPALEAKLEEDEDLYRHSEKELLIDGQTIKVIRPDSIQIKNGQIQKSGMLRYYCEVADYILPYLKDRPQLVRTPSKKIIQNIKTDKWISSFERMDETTGKTELYVIASNTASMIYLANNGCFVFRPWHSRVSTPQYPDWCVISVESQKSFVKLTEVAGILHRVLRSFDIASYPKTSTNGIDVYIPLAAKFNYEQSRQFAELLVNMLLEEIPNLVVKQNDLTPKQNEVTISFQQNFATAVAPAPYSLLSNNSMVVSAPLHWDEVKPGLNPSGFTMQNIRERIQAEGEIFHPVMSKGVDLNQLLKGLSYLLAI